MPPKGKKQAKKAKDEEVDKGPLLIAVGPELCGKSAYLSSLQEDVVDYSIEDIPQLFEKVPLATVLSRLGFDDNELLKDAELLAAHNAFQDRNSYSRSILDRVGDLAGSEQAALALLFTDTQNFSQVEGIFLSVEDSALRSTLVEAVRNALSAGKKMTSKTIDLFVPQAAPYATTEAMNKLKDSLRTNAAVIGWNTTSLVPHTYADALKAAEQNKRSVRFIRWGHEISKVTLEELVRRNVHKFLSTGRYVPVAVIKESYELAENLSSTASDHESYASAVGYTLDENSGIPRLSGKAKSVGPPVAYTRWAAWFDQAVVLPIGSDDDGAAAAAIEERRQRDAEAAAAAKAQRDEEEAAKKAAKAKHDEEEAAKAKAAKAKHDEEEAAKAKAAKAKHDEEEAAKAKAAAKKTESPKASPKKVEVSNSGEPHTTTHSPLAVRDHAHGLPPDTDNEDETRPHTSIPPSTVESGEKNCCAVCVIS